MLYKQSKEYLLEKLKAAGLKSKPYTTQKGLESRESHRRGAVRVADPSPKRLQNTI